MPPLKIAPAREAERPKKRRSDMSHDERAAEIVDHLRDAIESRKDGSEKPGGMSYRDWRKLAQQEIAEALRDTALRAAVGEVMSARRIGNLALRVSFMLLAAVASFFAFWFGVVWVGQEYGAAWSTLATITALLLAAAFIAGGLMVGSRDGDPKDQIDPDRM
ncbi:MAG: hypothetical protein ACK4ZN_02830 [Oceanibaculum sp.]